MAEAAFVVLFVVCSRLGLLLRLFVVVVFSFLISRLITCDLIASERSRDNHKGSKNDLLYMFRSRGLFV